MKKILRTVFFAFIFSVFTTVVFAHGKSDVESIDVDNVHSWQESFDLEGKKPGKYNIIVTANDLGGNSYIEGPFNIILDPASDLPVCGITNPYPGMRVVGNLNVVGTCVDDDAVKYVEMYIDDDDDHKIRVDGREFWSYYLDTTRMAEGKHKITVIGYDINGLAGKTTSVEWNLDRNLPVTEVADKTMGMLLSGTVKFHGDVADGNGINDLWYSLNNGESFRPVKVTRKKVSTTFDLSIDTKKFPDGPNVIWFKASDMTGSIGYYSFLFFIDNTKPDVQIVTPTEKEESSGKFTVAGYAKDKVGITRIKWVCGSDSGDIELTPGNPYWSVDFDTIGSTDKSRKFTIEAEDKAGNVVSLTRTLLLNQELDRPVVTLIEPKQKQNIAFGEDIFVRGEISDDDGVASVQYQIDDEDPIIEKSNGIFYKSFLKADELSVGKHKITIIATDIDGVESRPLVTEINIIGNSPEFAEPVISLGKESVEYKKGMEVHPEAGSSFVIKTTSEVGLKQVGYTVFWGKNNNTENLTELKNVLSYNLSVPIDSKLPLGVVKVRLKAIDIYDRVSEYDSLFYVKNTTVIKSDLPELFFEDSVVGPDGSIISDFEHPVTGYVLGGKPKSVEVDPESPFVKAKIINENQIQLIPQKGAIGNSEKLKIRVTTDAQKVVESQTLVFKSDTEFPTIKLSTKSDKVAVKQKGNFSIKGNVTCKTKVGKLGYKIIPVTLEMKGGVVTGAKVGEIPSSRTDVKFKEEDGSFNISVNAGAYEPGMYVVEIVAESAGGNKTCASYAFSTVPDIETDENGKTPAAKAPMIVWVDSYDVYSLAVYQGNLDNTFNVYSRDKDLIEGSNLLVMDVTDPVSGKISSGKYNAVKEPTLKVHFASVNGVDYSSGMPVVLDTTTKDGNKATLLIDTGGTVNSVSYEISGRDETEVPGGQNVVTGNIKVTKPTDGSTIWYADIPLNNLPARVTKIKATVQAGTLQQEIVGHIQIIREVESNMIDDEEKIYSIVPKETVYNKNQESYVLSNGSTFQYYANLRMPISAKIISNKEEVDTLRNLALSVDGHLITLSAKKEGVYKGIKIQVSDAQGEVFESDSFNFISDSTKPDLKLITPELHQWLGNKVRISGTAADGLGVRSVEYSLNGGETWKEFIFSLPDNLEDLEDLEKLKDTTNNLGVTFNEDIDISSLPDGLIRLDVRAIDSSGLVSSISTACFKDVTPPEVTIIEPLEIDTVNGETLILFKVHDNGLMAKAEYLGPLVLVHPADPENGIAAEYRKGDTINLPIETFMKVTVGTTKCPIDESMGFNFVDAAGNIKTFESWDFTIDNESDLPISEIHLPTENEVITRDFTISGVIYDDDGDATIFYKIDDGEFMQYPTVGTSFSIKVPLVSMEDNEHTVTVYAVDTNGVVGEPVTRTFRVSLEEPKGGVELPVIETSVSGKIKISGWASDKNEIEKVQISLDNGNTYNDAVGTESWHYNVDTRAIPGGTQVVFLKVFDKYGIQGLYSSLINIDNDAPSVELDLPLDDSTTSGPLFFSGFTYDNVAVTELYITVRDLENNGESHKHEFPLDRIIGETIDMTYLESGFYNVQLTAADKAGNKTNISRNIHLDKDKAPIIVDVLYPLNGEHKNGNFNIYGQAESEVPIVNVKLYIDNQYINSTDLSNSNFYAFEVTPEMLKDGQHNYYIAAVLADGTEIASRAQTITYSATGPWITIDNFNYGDFATDRPWIQGKAGYAISADEVLFSKTKEATPDVVEAVRKKTVEKVEISFDNGKTFQQLSLGEKWMYRVENTDMREGYHFMLVRATMKNGEVAVTRTIIQIDNEAPTIKLIAPYAGGRYNQELAILGLSNDNVALENVAVTLRRGDKAAYEIPSFIQGLYVDISFWGATLFNVGIGLTAFDNVVKLQFNWGQFTQNQRDRANAILGLGQTDFRYGGNMIFGAKIIANIANLPFSYFFGHDWEWLYASVSLGANFTRFNETNSGQPQILSSILVQLEFPQVKLKKAKNFSAFALYTEASLWFITTDVSTPEDVDEDIETVNNLVPTFTVGLRVNIF